MSDKREIRLEMQARREALGPEDRQALSTGISQRILAAPWVSQANTVMAYLPTRGEVDLGVVFDTLEKKGVTLVFPKVISRREGHMEPYGVPQGWREHVVAGPFNILAPGDTAFLVDPKQIDTILIPGVAFDRQFYRLGFGGGFYDRFLPRLANTCLIGVAYEFQVIPEVPRDPHDIRLDVLCTEAGTWVRDH